MTNVKYLKENNLYNAHKNFMRMVEGFGYSSMVQEEGEDDENQGMGGAPDGGMGAPPAGGMGGPDGGAGAPPDGGMGGTPDGGAGAPPDGGMGAPDGGMGAPPDGGMGGPPDGGAGAPPDDGGMGGPPDDGMGAPPDMGAPDEEPEEDAEMLDVEDLTQAQEKTKDKINSVGRDLAKVDNRINKLLGAIEQMQGMIDNNNRHIEALSQEFKKRNPTETERLNLRSLDSYPFNVTPDQFWKEKSATSNYDVYSDNDEPTTDEYVITNDDVDDMNEREVSGTFYVNDDLRQDINKIFGF